MNIDRNDLCPCGSGKKYKDCCGNVVVIGQFPQQRLSSKLISELIEFAKSDHDDEVNEGWLQFWGDFDYEQLDEGVYEMGLQNFFDWVVYDLQVDDNGSTLIEDFLTHRDDLDLSKEEEDILLALNDSLLSLYEVESIELNKGLVLSDLLLGGSYFVNEAVASNYLHRWDILATRLLHLDDIYIMSGAGYVIQRYLQREIVETFQEELRLLQNSFSGITMHSLLKFKGWTFNSWWYEPFMRARQLTVVNSGGELMVLAVAIYRIADIESIKSSLSLSDDFDREEDNFIWIDNSQGLNKRNMLGTVNLDNSTLKLETSSKERLDMGKILLEKALGSLITHKADTYQDIQQAIEDAHIIPLTGDEISPEVVQQAYEQLMNLHYEQWIDDKLPALEGKSPKEAMSDNRLRSIVIDIIKDIENSEEKNRELGRPFFNPLWIRERLGLQSDEF